MNIQLKSPDLKLQLNQIVEQVHEDARDCLYHMGLDILDTATMYTPVWTGSLASTGFIKQKDSGMTTIGFASDPAYDKINPETGIKVSEYAWEVHEVGTIYNILRPIWVDGPGDTMGHYVYEEVEVKTHGPYKYLTNAATEVFNNWNEYFKELPVKVTEDSWDKIELDEGGFIDEGYLPF